MFNVFAIAKKNVVVFRLDFGRLKKNLKNTYIYAEVYHMFMYLIDLYILNFGRYGQLRKDIKAVSHFRQCVSIWILWTIKFKRYHCIFIYFICKGVVNLFMF